MKRIDDDTIALTQQELDDIRFFIRETLYREWDYYTDHLITTRSNEEGMRSMNKEMYDFADQIAAI
jgi:hypothetical protein